MADKFYIATSIPYVNAKPHIGHGLEFIQADVLARYHRLKGDDVYFQIGTDEHGMKMVQTAREQNTTPEKLGEQNSAAFSGMRDLLNISSDYFIRTTNADHIAGAIKIWNKLLAAGDIYKNSYEGLYCVGCEAFVLEKDLVEGKCPNHNKPPEKLKEENYFFKLSKYTDKIKDEILSGRLKIVPESRKNEILSVLNDGLRDVSFSRPKKVLQWGIDVPNDPDHVMYVWCDALSNYITGVDYANEGEKFKRYWPTNVNLIGKDILRFHAAIWIGMLMSAGEQLPHAVYVHGFITSEGKKMSKSLNNVVDPSEYANTYGTDALRYFLMKEIPTTDDGDFSKDRFLAVYESELANNIGNLVSRVLAMTGKYFDFKVPEADKSEGFFGPIFNKFWQDYEKAIADFDLKKALEIATEVANLANKYVEDNKPWVLAKENKEQLEKVIYALLEMIRHLALMLLPFIPASVQKVFEYLGVETDYKIEWGILKPGTVVKKAEPLFARIQVVAA